MPRFVLLRHVAGPSSNRPSHWDFMLESDGKLLTWSLQELPAIWGGLGDSTRATTAAESTDGVPPPSSASSVAADRIADHRLSYLQYEGAISEDRGTVSRIDGGKYDVLETNERGMTISLQGTQINGLVQLLAPLTEGGTSLAGSRPNWTLIATDRLPISSSQTIRR